MTGRGRSPRVGSKPPPTKGTAANSRAQLLPARTRPGSRTAAGLATTTRNNSGSPSTRTRSLTPLATPIRGKGRAASRGRGAAATVTTAALARPAVPLTSSSPAKKRDEKKSRGKGRRPKFQDNPPAPEIVEKKELKSEMSNKDEDAVEEVCDKDQVPVASANGHGVQADEESEEEEVDDDEPAQLEMVNND